MREKIFEGLDPTKPLPGAGSAIATVSRARGLLWTLAKLAANGAACAAPGQAPTGAPHQNRGDGLCSICGQPAMTRGYHMTEIAQAAASIDPSITSVWDVAPILDWLERRGAIRPAQAAPGLPPGTRLWEVVPEVEASR
jgi:hypothetical protein